MATNKLETEVKLGLVHTTKESLHKRLEKNPLLNVTQSSTSHISNTYYDTIDGCLSRIGAALRRREIGNCSELTLKMTMPPKKEGVMERREWNIAGKADRQDFSLFQFLPSIPSSVKKVLKGNSLNKLCDNNFYRHDWLITFNKTNVTLSLDQGTICSGKYTQRINEIELELGSGSREDLISISCLVAGQIRCWLSFVSKLARGLILANSSICKLEQNINGRHANPTLSCLSWSLDPMSGPDWDVAIRALNKFEADEAKYFADYIRLNRAIPSGLGRWMLEQICDQVNSIEERKIVL